MTLAEARAALGTLDVRAGADTLGCDYVHSRNLPSGVNVMVVEGKVARIDVKTREVTTTEGARVGDSEQRALVECHTCSMSKDVPEHGSWQPIRVVRIWYRLGGVRADSCGALGARDG